MENLQVVTVLQITRMEKEGKILVVDDNEDILLTAKVILKKHFQKIKTINSPALLDRLLEFEDFDVVLLDMNFTLGATNGKEGIDTLRKIKKKSPSTNVVMITAYGDINLAVSAMKEGATDFVVKPWSNKNLLSTAIAAYRLAKSRNDIHRTQKKEKLDELPYEETIPQIIGNSKEIREIFKTIDKVASTDANVLILGENGTGKELVARAIHEKSFRKSQIFMSVDLGALSETLFESELFGHKKGAFTDAKEQRTGRFEAANGGTLFLDEIGNLNAPLQSKLLTALQNREVLPLGGNTPIKVDVRIISATNMPLYEMTRTSQFRQDLLYRINTVVINIPPLRQRTEDIPILANHFLDIFSKKYNKRNLNFSPSAMVKLCSYSFPGNIRELRHIVERATIMSENNVLSPDDFTLQVSNTITATDNLSLEEIEKQALVKAIEKNKGNLTKAAKELGLGRTTMYRKMKKYEI